MKFKKFSISGKISIILISLIIIIGIFAPWISPYSHDAPSGNSLERPSKEHLLGTDDLGIDLLSQIFYGKCRHKCYQHKSRSKLFNKKCQC